MTSRAYGRLGRGQVIILLLVSWLAGASAIAGDDPPATRRPYDDTGRFYFYFETGDRFLVDHQLVGDVRFDQPNDFDLVLGGGGGYNISDHWGVELQAHGIEIDVRSDSLQKLEEYSNITLVPAARFRWPLGPDRRLVPFLTAGLGYSINEDNDQHNPRIKIKTTDSTLVGALAAGLEYFLNPDVAVGFSVRSLIFPDQDVSITVRDQANRVIQQSDGSFNQTSVSLLVHLRVFFGTQAESGDTSTRNFFYADHGPFDTDDQRFYLYLLGGNTTMFDTDFGGGVDLESPGDFNATVGAGLGMNFDKHWGAEIQFFDAAPNVNASPFGKPVYAYEHSGGAVFACAITGGAFYNPPVVRFPAEHVGKYFFADYCAGWIKRLDPVTKAVSDFATGASFPVGLATGPDGALYYLTRGDGALTGVVWRIDFGAGQGPSISQHPQALTVAAGEPATFTVVASGAAPLSYQWQRNTNPISGATGSSYTLNPATAGDNGAQFRVVVTNSGGSATSNAATLTVGTNQPPVGTVVTPVVGQLYSGGDIVGFSATATDPEDGPLTAAGFCWQIDFHHDTHTHPFFPETCGLTQSSVLIPNTGETAPTVWYRFRLTVRDSAGRTHASFVDVQPRRVTLTFDTNPAGLPFTLDGQPVNAPHAVQSVVGVRRAIGAHAGSGGTRFQFVSWSDGGAATHNISTPAANATYAVTYQVQHLLTTASAPLGGGVVSVSPPSADGFYSAGAALQITAIPEPGFTFTGWSGALSGTTAAQSMALNAPASVVANFFSTTGPCTYELGRDSGSYAGGGDMQRVEIVTNAGCNWTVANSTPWITLLSPQSGAGEGDVIFRVEPNPSSSPRVAVFTIAGISYTVTQSSGACTFTLAAPISISAAGGSFSTSVVTEPGCFWLAAAAPEDWITVTGASASGLTGPGAATFNIEPNQDGEPRAGAIEVGGQLFHVLQQEAQPVQVYSDVPVTDSFQPFISMVRENQSNSGCSPTTFCPNQITTRAMMAAFIIRALHGEGFAYPSTPYFTDVTVSHPQFSYIQKMRELGVTAGCSLTTYCPDQPVTRGQMAVFLVRARDGVSNTQTFPFSPSPYFTDVPAAHEFFPYIQKLRATSITAGCGAGAFCPDATTLRGQMAVFLVRAFLTP